MTTTQILSSLISLLGLSLTVTTEGDGAVVSGSWTGAQVEALCAAASPCWVRLDGPDHDVTTDESSDDVVYTGSMRFILDIEPGDERTAPTALRTDDAGRIVRVYADGSESA